MLYMDSALPAKSVEEWVLSDGFTKHRVAIDRLVQLRIFSEEKYVPYWIVCNFFYETGWLEIESNFGNFMLFLSMLVNTMFCCHQRRVFIICVKFSFVWMNFQHEFYLDCEIESCAKVLVLLFGPFLTWMLLLEKQANFVLGKFFPLGFCSVFIFPDKFIMALKANYNHI